MYYCNYVFFQYKWHSVGFVLASIGLAARCPLLPYLFILCTDIFSTLIHATESVKTIQGVRFASDLFISHLLFADDSLVFCQASLADCC